MPDKKKFTEVGVHWMDQGYFATPLSASDLLQLPEPERSLWSIWQDRFFEAKRGNFRGICDLIDVYEKTESWTLGGACAELLGNAGDEACLEQMAERMSESPDAIVHLTMQIEFSDAFGIAGVLALVPTIVETYRRHHTFDDAEILPGTLSAMLEPTFDAFCEPREYGSIDAYCTAVLDRHAELSARLSPRAIIFRGEVFSMRRHALAVLDSLASGNLKLRLRQQFEASTGIETAQFYKGGRLQPLTAAAIVEGFLASPVAAHYVDGARYFFGHRIPESAPFE